MSLANELRIGNWVEILGNSKRLDFFTTIQPSSFSVNIEKTYGPIPLDEDWLQKFGFEKNQNGLWHINNTNNEIYLLNQNGYQCCDIDEIFFIGEKLQYVHQLQNLFFALTQTELQFNK
jgi:hypothetical protein